MKFSKIITIVLTIIVAIETTLLIPIFLQKNKLQIEVQTITEELNELKINQVNLSNEKNNALDKIKTLDQQIVELNQEVNDSADQISTLQEENATLSKNLTSSKSEITQKNSQISALKSKYVCKDAPITVDFKDNSSVSKSLVKYVESHNNTGESVTSHYWNTIWTGDKYSIHTVSINVPKENVNYIWKFTAYFDGEAYGDHSNGIFYNDGQCWLYLKD